MTTRAGRTLASAALLLLPACGHRGDPLPPLRHTPPALSEFRIAQRGDALEVSARAPRASVDGVVYSKLRVEVLWAEGTADLEKGGKRRAVEATPGARLVEQLPLPAPGTLVRVAARPSAGGDRGPRTLILALVAQAPLEAPRELAGRLDAAGVALEWSGRVPEPVAPPDLGPVVGPPSRHLGGPSPRPGPAPEGRGPTPGGSAVPPTSGPGSTPTEGASPASERPPPPAAAVEGQPGASPAPGGEKKEGEARAIPHGFRVYRRVAPAPYGSPLSESPTAERSLTDTAPPLGQSACYVVRAVASTDPLIESAPSNEVCVDVRDIVSPGPPVGVAVLPRADGLEVVWSPSPEKDLAGYRVYRQSGEGERTRVAEVPVGTTTWVDDAAEPGLLHRYTVTAVDTAGNESSPSTAAEGRRR